MNMRLPSRPNRSNRSLADLCCFDFGPPSATRARRQNNTGSTIVKFVCDHKKSILNYVINNCNNAAVMYLLAWWLTIT